jgi:uncharacterized protein (TIGR02246 family)
LNTKGQVYAAISREQLENGSSARSGDPSGWFNEDICPAPEFRIGARTMSEQEVLDLVQQWATAELKEDADTLGELLAEDFNGIGPLGFVLTKQQWTGRYRGGDLHNTAFDVVDAQVRLYGDTAVVVGVQKQETSFQGHDTGGEFRLTLVAVRRDGGWSVANIQLSGPLGPPPGMPPSFKKD